MAAKHGDLVNHEARVYPKEHAAKHGDHLAYEQVEHHHIMHQRLKDHGYIDDTGHPEDHSSYPHGTFKQFGEDQDHGEHTKHMHTFYHNLRKVGHASHPDHHHAK